MVPEGWTNPSLGELLEFQNGVNTEAANYGSGSKFVNVMDVFDNAYLTANKIRGAVEVGEKQNKSYALQYGDILFNRTSETFDEIALSAVYLDKAHAIFGGFVIRGRPTTDRLHPEFCQYCLLSDQVRRETIRRGQGAIRSNIGQTDLAKVSIQLPPLPEQKKISKILSTWDRAIEVTEKLLENATQQKRALMQQLLTGKHRLRGFHGDWINTPVGKMGRCISGITYAPSDVTDDKGLLVLRSSNIQKGKLTYLDNVFVSLDIKEEQKTKEGDILVCVRNGSKNLIGKSAIINSEAAGKGHGAFMTLFRSDISDYISHIFQSESFYRQVYRNLGATINSINVGNLYKFRFPLPPREEQIAIAEVIQTSESERVQFGKQLDLFRTEKKALMQQLLTGKRRVVI